MLWQHLYPICIRFFEYTAWNLFRGFLVSLAFTQPGVDTIQDFIFVQAADKTTYSSTTELCTIATPNLSFLLVRCNEPLHFFYTTNAPIGRNSILRFQYL